MSKPVFLFLLLLPLLTPAFLLLAPLQTQTQTHTHHHAITTARRRTMGTLPLTPLQSSMSFDDDGEPQFDAAARSKIEETIKKNKVVLFMKGNRLFPSCGFSNTAIRILDQLQVEYETVDVLADERIRSEIKRFSAWPTIPQLYLQGEFIGGSDILLEMYNTGELQEMIEIAAAS